MIKNFIQSLHCGGHGVLHRAAVGDDGIRRREIQGAALRLHLPERLGAGRERPSAAHRQRIQRPVDKEHDAVLVQGAQIFAPLDDAAAAGEQLTALFCKAGGLGRLPRPEAVLALGGEDVRDAAAVGLHDLLVEVDEPLAQLVCQQTAHRGLAAGGHPDQADIAQFQFDYIRKKAESGESFVVVGRCSETVLKDYDCLMSVFVTGDKEQKIQRVMERYDISESDAYSKMRRHDKSRKQYHNKYSDFKWGDARYYDMCINSSPLGVDKTVNVLENYVKERTRE